MDDLCSVMQEFGLMAIGLCKIQDHDEHNINLPHTVERPYSTVRYSYEIKRKRNILQATLF